MDFEISMSSESELTILNKNEVVLTPKSIKDYFKIEEKKGNEKMSNKYVPTKNSYESAKETVKQYEKRQAELKYVQKELSFKLKQFSQVKFKIDKIKSEIVFAGVHKDTNKLLLSKTVCNKQDVFDANIGKLIVVKKALQEDLDEVIKLVESKPYTPWYSGGLITNGTLLTTATNNLLKY